MSSSSVPAPTARLPGRARVFWPLLLATTIWVGSANQTVDGPPGIPFLDKAAHLLIYGLLAVLTVRVFFSAAHAGRSFAIAVALVALYGASDELHQSFNPNRSMELADWIADVSGAIIATAMYVWIAPWRGWLEHSLAQPIRRGRGDLRAEPATTPANSQ